VEVKRKRSGFEVEAKWIRNGCEMDAKRIRNGFEMDAKWMRNGCEMDAKGIRKGYERDAKEMRKGCERDMKGNEGMKLTQITPKLFITGVHVIIPIIN
jgi:hypothetical protein